MMIAAFNLSLENCPLFPVENGQPYYYSGISPGKKNLISAVITQMPKLH
jgi:hypothetical protein